MSKVTILDIENKCLFSDIRNSYFGYPKFRISQIMPKRRFISDIQKSYLDIQNNILDIRK